MSENHSNTHHHHHHQHHHHHHMDNASRFMYHNLRMIELRKMAAKIGLRLLLGIAIIMGILVILAYTIG